MPQKSCERGFCHVIAFSQINTLAGFRANSEIIGKFRKLKKLYGHFVERQK